MKIVMLAAGFPPDIRGGGEFSSQVLAESLAKAGAEMHILACSAKPEDYTANQVHVRKIESPNIYWSFSPKPKRWRRLIWHVGENYNPLALAAVAGFVKETKADLVLTSTIENFGAEGWRAPAKLGVKSVHILRSYYPMCHRATAFRNGGNCLSSCVSCRTLSVGRRQASQHVDGVIGLSRATLDRHVQEGLFKRAARAVLPDAVYAVPRNMAPRTLGRAPVFGYLGFLTPNKGLETIADAMRGTDAKVLIAGKGDDAYVSRLKGEFAGINATFLGWKDNEEFLSAIDYLIVPSLFMEPFGRIVVEAFTAGVPVIGSRIGGIGEMVTPDANGFLFTPGDRESLASAIGAAQAGGPECYAALSAGAINEAGNYASPVVAQKKLKFFEAILSDTLKSGEEWQG